MMAIKFPKGSQTTKEYNLKVQRAVMCKILRKTPEEIDQCDYQDLVEVGYILDEIGDKNPLFFL